MKKQDKLELLAYTIAKSTCCKQCSLALRCNEKAKDLKQNKNNMMECYLVWLKYLVERM